MNGQSCRSYWQFGAVDTKGCLQWQLTLCRVEWTGSARLNFLLILWKKIVNYWGLKVFRKLFILQWRSPLFATAKYLFLLLQEETSVEKHPWLGHRGQVLRKMNPREAEEPPVQSEPVDLSRRIESEVEDSTNNNHHQDRVSPKDRWHAQVCCCTQCRPKRS